MGHARPDLLQGRRVRQPQQGSGHPRRMCQGRVVHREHLERGVLLRMNPKEGDILITGKKGLDAFPNTTLEAELKKAGIETVILCGFLTNCCVESTMRTACEKGFNVITVVDCCATLSAA